MKTCPRCHRRNQDSNTSCEACGSLFPSPSFQEKKEMVLDEKGRSRSWRAIAIGVMAFVGLAGFGYWYFRGESVPSDSKAFSSPRVNARFNYAGQTVAMSDISVKVENGKISIPLETVLEKKLVRFEYGDKETRLPLLAYVTPTGKITTAVSLCEPCRSTRFHIEGRKLVCNACSTQWDLETLKGIQGGCLKYPPDAIPSTMEKGLIQIDEKAVKAWKPRV